MTSKRNRHHCRGYAAPYYLRGGLLIVLDGVPGSGRSTQLRKLREAQHLFLTPPVLVELPHDVHGAEAVAPRVAALSALREGRTVVAERWTYDDALPDLVALSLTSFTARPPAATPWQAVPHDRRLVLPEGHEGLVAVELWTELARRRYFGTCPCVVAA